MIKVLRAKLHGITVTGADLNYHGSITLDPEQCGIAGIVPLEYVEIWNKNSGARISTYVIFGEPGSKCCILNGAAARTCQMGDEIIVAASEYINDKKDLYSIKPVIITYKTGNEINDILKYEVFSSKENDFNFRITDNS